MRTVVVGFLVMSIAIGAVATPCLEWAFIAMLTQDNTVLLRWSVSPLDGVVGFNIRRSTEPDGQFVLVNEDLLPPESPGQYEDTGVQPATQYWYHLYALMDTGAEEQLTPEPVAVTTGGSPVRELGWGGIKALFQ